MRYGSNGVMTELIRIHTIKNDLRALPVTSHLENKIGVNVKKINVFLIF